ncbi:MAG: hypothetical protein K2M34_03530 [Alphaproteobacteria bacterium]|nr:hypothetical protein [Alphaproteobacteria bacterium]
MWRIVSLVMVFICNSAVACPRGYSFDLNGDCIHVCAGGYYMASPGNKDCSPVGTSFYSPGGPVSYGDTSIRYPCPMDYTTSGYGAAADDIIDCGRTLHIGDSVLHMRTEPQTVHSLRLRQENTIFYADVTPVDKVVLNETLPPLLHVRMADTTYIVHDDMLTSQSEIHYLIEDGRIVWANPKLYLRSAGQQYIDTDFVPSNDAGMMLFYIDVSNSNADVIYAGSQHGIAGNSTDQYDRFSFGANSRQNYYGWNNYHYCRYASNSGYIADDGAYLAELNFKNNRQVIYNSVIIASNLPELNASNDLPVRLFANNNSSNPFSKGSVIKMYYAVFTRGAEIVMHFVPVPAGMQIGDFTVPENGMWDIIEGRFYGNMGSGAFQYGAD